MTNEQPAPAPPPQPAASAPNFFSSLFDIRFGSYITPKIISVLYVLGMVGIAIMYLVYVFIAFNANAGFGVLMLLVIGPLMALLFLVFFRVTLEFYLALVRLSQDFKEFREEWRVRR